MAEHEDESKVRVREIVLKPKEPLEKLSWEETAREMAVSDEDWSDWEAMPDGWDAVTVRTGSAISVEVIRTTLDRSASRAGHERE